nr:MAG: RNA-dependent RNA polymerase [Riboviria sp.]
MGRKTVPIAKTMSDGKPLNRQTLFKLMDKYMPTRANNNWPGVHGDFYEALTNSLEITPEASAGAPYWRPKGECLEDILDVGIPVLLQHIKSNTLDKLWREQPEMFLVEVKNKLDRYEVSKLGEKTRPYVCVPGHLAFLFSLLTQGFQKKLAVFDEVGVASCNAYGFSSAKGGLKRMAMWMRTAGRRGKGVFYGDDGCIVFKVKGQIYRVDPDFKQMDGSLDADDISLTVDWVINHLEKDLGETSQFWRSVGELWKSMATNPYFIVDGMTIYKKKNPHGLMTGIPGTTLFDTVKSVMSWNRLFDICDRGEGSLLDESFVVKWMASQGLVVKPGTWSPQPLPEYTPGTLLTDHKFLGVQILCTSWKGGLEFVPTIPFEDAVEMIVVQKDNPYMKVKSQLGAARTLYDRMRGLMITMGFTIPEISDAIHNVVNRLPATAILLDVQIEGGQKPEHITLQDFTYPDSTGFPSYDFCVSVYSDRSSQEEWVQLYPDLTERLIEMKANRRRINREYNFKVGDGVPRTIQVEPKVEKPIPKEYEHVEAQTSAHASYPPFNKRSKIAVYDDAKYVEEKRMPTLGESVHRFLNAVGGVSQLGVVCERLGVTAHLIVREAPQYGFYVTGNAEGDLVSQYPIATPFCTVQESVAESIKTNVTIGPGAQQRQEARKKSPYMLRTAPEMVFVVTDAFAGLNYEGPPVADDEEALRVLHKVCTTVFPHFSWSSDVDLKRGENTVCARLRLAALDQTVFVAAEAWSTTKRLAQAYIAKAVFEIAGIPVRSSVFSTPVKEPPHGGPWIDVVEYEEDPRRPPVVVDPTLEPPESLMENLSREFKVPVRRVKAAYFVNQSAPNPTEESLRNLLQRLIVYDARRAELEEMEKPFRAQRSKRSRLSPAVKANKNRKLHEKRKARLRELSTP